MQYIINLMREEHDEDDAAIEEAENVAAFILDLPEGADTEYEVAAFERDLFQQLTASGDLPGNPYVFYTTYTPLLATVTDASDGAKVALAGLARYEAAEVFRRQIWSPATSRDTWAVPIAEQLRTAITNLRGDLSA